MLSVSLSVWVRDCRSAVRYDSSILLMIGSQSVSCRLSIGLKSGDSMQNLTRHDEPDWFYGVFSNIVGGRQLPDSLKFMRFLSVSCRFGRCDWGIKISMPHVIKLVYRAPLLNYHILQCLILSGRILVIYIVYLFTAHQWRLRQRLPLSHSPRDPFQRVIFRYNLIRRVLMTPCGDKYLVQIGSGNGLWPDGINPLPGSV